MKQVNEVSKAYHIIHPEGIMPLSPSIVFLVYAIRGPEELASLYDNATSS
jgi:hypothetical protein